MPLRSDRSLFDRPRWTERDARAVLSALERSGKPVRAFAAEHGLDAQRVYVWRRRLGEAERTTFQEVVVRPVASQPLPGPGDSGFAIALVSGDVVRVPASFDSAALGRLLEVVTRVRAC